MGSLHSLRFPSPVAEPEREPAPQSERQPALQSERQPTVQSESSCIEAFAREIDYLYWTLQRLGARSTDAEDLLQDVFVILYRHWDTLDLTRPLRPWLFGVAFRVVRAQRRRRSREVPYAGLDIEDAAAGPEGWVQGQESLETLRLALERVPIARRSVVIKHDLEGVEVVDIARELSLTKFGVYARLHKGRKELALAVHRLLKEGVRP